MVQLALIRRGIGLEYSGSLGMVLRHSISYVLTCGACSTRTADVAADDARESSAAKASNTRSGRLSVVRAHS